MPTSCLYREVLIPVDEHGKQPVGPFPLSVEHPDYQDWDLAENRARIGVLFQVGNQRSIAVTASITNRCSAYSSLMFTVRWICPSSSAVKNPPDVIHGPYGVDRITPVKHREQVISVISLRGGAAVPPLFIRNYNLVRIALNTQTSPL